MYACLHVPDLTPAQKPCLMRCAAEFSPILEPGPDYVVADIQGLGTLMGRPRHIADRIKVSLNTAGFHQSRVAVAANTHAATVAARGLDAPVTVIEPGDESRALAILPLSFLNPVPELLETLSAWGIHTFGDLSRLPETGLAERLGPEGVRLHLLARGCSPVPLVPESEAPDFSASIELDHPLDSLEPLAFLFGRLLNDICGRLVSHGLAATEVRSTLGLENKTEYERIIRLPYATTDNATLLKLLQYDLSAHPPQAAIVKVTLIAQPSPQRRVQGGLFIPVAPGSGKARAYTRPTCGCCRRSECRVARTPQHTSCGCVSDGITSLRIRGTCRQYCRGLLPFRRLRSVCIGRLSRQRFSLRSGIHNASRQQRELSEM